MQKGGRCLHGGVTLSKHLFMPCCFVWLVFKRDLRRKSRIPPAPVSELLAYSPSFCTTFTGVQKRLLCWGVAGAEERRRRAEQVLAVLAETAARMCIPAVRGLLAYEQGFNGVKRLPERGDCSNEQRTAS